jgi:ligand-binding sensor domain-containing protein/signal transduction histidine kinase
LEKRLSNVLYEIMSIKLYYLLLFCSAALSCEREKVQQISFNYKHPKVVEARAYKTDTDKLTPPFIVRASNVTTRAAGKPEIIQLKSNVFPAKVSSTISAGSPQLVLKNGSRFESPHVIPAVNNPYAAGPPAITPLEAPYFRENNSGSFSAIKAMHGLNSNEISSLIQDKNGNLWIGEWWGGVARYDGRFLYNYTITQGLKSDVVNCVFEDSKGNIWIGTFNNGVNKFDGKNFTHYSVKEGLPDNSVNYIFQDKVGNMWFATNNGLARFDGRLFTHFTTGQGLPTNRIRTLMEDSKGQLWVGTHGGLTMFDGRSFQNYTVALHFTDDTYVSCIMEDGDANMWFATNMGLYKYEGGLIKHFTKEGGLSSNTITSITKESNGDIWIGTRGGGVNRYNGNSFTHFGPEQGLANEIVTSIVQDKWGNMWLGTTAGVCKYEGKIFSHITPVKQEEIEALLADHNGNIWMGSGTDSCLNKYDGRNMTRYTAATGLTNIDINQLYEDKSGNIWIATWNGVEKFDGTNLTHYSTVNGLVDNVVFCTFEDKNGILWFGTNKGLSRFDGKFFTNYLKPQGLCSETIFSILEDHSGNLWIGTAYNGICRFDGSSFTHYSLGNSLSHPSILGMIEDRNNHIWITTGLGVNKFDGKQFTWYTTDQGLTNNIVKNLVEDKKGNIWIGTINGLNRFISPVSSHDTGENAAFSYFKTYTITEGFSGAGTYENAMSMDERGNIWIGANDRLTRYHPEGDIPDTIAPILKLTGVSLFGENINWQNINKHKDSLFTFQNGTKLEKVEFSGLSQWYNQPQDLHLAYNNNYVTFQFIGITTNRPKEVKYRYILEGLDETWSSTAQPSAVYNNLPHGNYTFKVKSVNSEGYWSDELRYSFSIFPPWWQMKFAYWIYAIILAGMIWMFSWYRSRRLKSENILLEQKVITRTKELEQSLEERYKLSEQVKSQQALLNERIRISRELHDDIGSTLGSISIYSEVAKKRTEKNENPFTILSKIGSASRELIEKMSDIVWSLNLNSENFDHMQHRMVAFAAMILAPRNIKYEFIVDEETKRSQLTSAQAKNIFLIYKEALHNMVKYADCTSAVISFHTQNDELIMVIHDNGKGFHTFAAEAISPDKNPGGNGIRNMYARSEELNAKLTFDSKLNEGITIKLIVPVHHPEKW